MAGSGSVFPGERSSPGPPHPPPGSSGLRVPSLSAVKALQRGQTALQSRWDDDDDDDASPLPPTHNPLRGTGGRPLWAPLGKTCHVDCLESEKYLGIFSFFRLIKYYNYSSEVTHVLTSLNQH